MRTLMIVAFAVALCGCGGKQKTAVAPIAKEDAKLVLLGVDPMPLGADSKQVEAAFPPPEDASAPSEDDLKVLPDHPYFAWKASSQEIFAAVFDKDHKSLQEAIHRIRIQDTKEAEGIFADYAKRLGKGTRREGDNWIEVSYIRDGQKLVLFAKKENDFSTFNSHLSYTSNTEEGKKS
jgi:hypothetical protein